MILRIFFGTAAFLVLLIIGLLLAFAGLDALPYHKVRGFLACIGAILCLSGAVTFLYFCAQVGK